MPTLALREFGGQLPAWNARFLPPGQASYALNCYLYSGALDGWRVPTLLYTLKNTTSKYAYRVPVTTQGIAQANLLFLSNPNAGDTVTIGENTYTFSNAPVNPYDVLIGASPGSTSQNLFLALMFGQQDTTVAAAGTAASDQIAAGNPYLGYPFSNIPLTTQATGKYLYLVLCQASGTQLVESISFVPQTTNPTTNIQGGLYTNLDQTEVGNTVYENQPGMLMSGTQTVVGCHAGVPVVLPFTTPMTILEGELYWVGFVADQDLTVQLASTSTNTASISTVISNQVAGSSPGQPVIVPFVTGPDSGPAPTPPANVSPVVLPNPIIGQFAVSNPVAYGGPTLQLWANLAPIQSTDPENTLGSAAFSGTSVPYINVEAPDYGSAFNNIPVSASAPSRLIWTSDLASIAHITATLVGGANPVANTGITAPSLWLEFADQDTNVVRSPVVDDAFQRLYFVSPSQLPQYNTALRVQNSQPPFLLGVPAPSLPPSLSVAGGGTITTVGLNASSSLASEGTPGGYTFTAIPNPTTPPTAPTRPTGPKPGQQQQPQGQQQFMSGVGYGGFGGNIGFQDNGYAAYFVLQAAVTSGALQLNDIAVFIQQCSANQLVNPYTGKTYPPGTASFTNVPPVFMGFIYADNQGVPGALLGMAMPSNVPISVLTTLGLDATATTLPGTVVSFFSNPVQLAANTKYWIGGFFGVGTVVQLADDYNNLGTLYTTSADPTLFLDAVNSANGYNNYPVTSDPTYLTSLDPAPASMTALGADLQIWGDCINVAQLESRAYVYTWVTAYGEEGPPSAPAINDGYDNAVWTVGMFPPRAQDIGYERNIVGANLYRTVTSSTGPTAYFLVDRLDVGQSTYTDTIPDNIVAQNLTLPSDTWYAPPGDLQGIVSMPNGVLAGWKGNEIWFCEPYRPHAWPGGYTLTTEYPIVGLGVAGGALIACTESTPYVITGPSPGSMVATKVMHPDPCLSRAGIVGTDKGVFYPSPNGLIKVSPQGTAENVTEGWITREKWAQLTPQKYLRAVKIMSAYMAYGSTFPGDNTVAQQGYTIEMSEQVDAESFNIYPQPGRHRIGFNLLNAPGGVNIDNCLLDPWTGVVLLIYGGAVYQYDFTNPLNTTQVYTWRSKEFQAHHKDNYEAFRVWFDIPEGGPQTPPATATVAPPSYSTAINLPYTTGMFGVVRILADGNYVCERELRYSTQLMRIPSGFKAHTWQVEFQAVVPVSNMKLSTSVKELATDEKQG